MARLTFYIDDNDTELIEFVQSFGHFRSRIINVLLQDCLQEGDGYVPLRIMQETGFSYKGKQVNKKPVVKAKTKSVTQDRQEVQKAAHDIQPTHEAQQVKQPEHAVVEAEPQDITPTPQPEDNTDKNDYASSAPTINKDLVMAGLSAFGI